MTPSLDSYVILSGLLFAIGFFGVLLRRNTLVIFMCLELMLIASTLALVAFSHEQANKMLLAANRKALTLCDADGGGDRRWILGVYVYSADKPTSPPSSSALPPSPQEDAP